MNDIKEKLKITYKDGTVLSFETYLENVKPTLEELANLVTELSKLFSDNEIDGFYYNVE